MLSLSRILTALVLCMAVGISGVEAQANLTGSGASFPLPFYQKAFAAFHQKTKIQVNYQATGSSAGIDAIKNNTVNFAGSDAPLSNAQLAQMRGPMVQIPTCGGAVALAYNVPGMNKPLRLSPPTLAGIFLGTITKWNDQRLRVENPGVNMPNLPITVCRRSDGSGTTHLFTTYLSAVSPEWKSKVGAGTAVNWPVGRGGSKNAGVAALVKQIRGGIGYVELAYATENKIPVAHLRNKSGVYVAPTLASTTACIEGALPALQKDLRASIVNPSGQRAYPIVGLTFIMAYQNQPNAQTAKSLRDMLTFLLTDGQPMASSLQYAPLPPSVQKLCMSKVNAIK